MYLHTSYIEILYCALCTALTIFVNPCHFQVKQKVLGWHGVLRHGCYSTWVWTADESVRSVGILWPLQLHLQPLHAYLKAIHGLDSGLSTGWVIKTHKAWDKYTEQERDEGHKNGKMKKKRHKGRRMGNMKEKHEEEKGIG